MTILALAEPQAITVSRSEWPAPEPMGPRPPNEEAEWSPPPEFDGYRVVARVGQGGMGQVFLADDTLLDRQVAVKLVYATAAGERSAERLWVEARAVARLQHPNVVSIYRVGEVDGRPYFVSEFVHGTSLDQLPTPLPGPEVLRLAIGLARGLFAAHCRGVLHRDIKPANAILSESGEIKLLDFGLAKLVSEREPDGADRLRSAPEAWQDGARIEPSGAITRPGAQMGTPAYMAPEVWLGETATFSSDLYSLGAVLYHLCAGHPPHQGSTIEALREAVLAREPAPLTEVEPRLARIIARCLSRDPNARFESADALRESLESLLPQERSSAPVSGNPYRGLHAFEAEHRALFFGRESEVRAVLERLRYEPFLLVAGTSGVGKSSLCRAGLLPAVAEGALGEDRWDVVTLTPGKHPLSAFAAALARVVGSDEESLLARLREDVAEVGRALRRTHAGGRPLLMFVDQLEELVTLSDPEEIAPVVELLEVLATFGPGPRLLATCRGDFIARLGSLPGMGDWLTRGLYLLRPMTRQSVREAIVGPARLQGVSFESDALLEALLDSTERTSGALPLLQFALAELWEARDARQRIIPAAALDSIGGVEGALARHADGVLAHLPPLQRAAARRILPRLVTVDATRARRTEAELVRGRPGASAALDALVRGRLLVATEAPEGSAYEVAHEALIRSWPALQRWLDEDAEQRAQRERLAAVVADWQRAERAHHLLWGRRRIAELKALELDELSGPERAFLAASARANGRRRWGWLAAITLISLVVGGGYLGMWLRSRRGLRTRVDALVGRGRRLLDEGRRESTDARAHAEAAFRAFDLNAPTAEKIWASAGDERASAQSTLARSGQAFESALMLGQGTRARDLLADVLLARARLADETRHPVQRDELLERMALYDANGARRRAWEAPTPVHLESAPPGARVFLERYGPHRSLEPGRTELGTTPLDISLPAGSYRFSFDAPGRTEARLPVLVRRGRPLRLDVPIPREIPRGFVYVPPGSFLFGSDADESMRRDFFHAEPLHRVTTPGYLIARHETTFAEWLAFLDALPPKARAQHTPRIRAGGFRGALALERGADGWHLEMQPAGVLFRAPEGQRLRYPDRARRAAQDWLKLPVVGIDDADTQAYVAWLRRSGRVPGARLCSEREWERAARGADGRPYPEGDRLRPDDADFDETYQKRPGAMGPDDVGSHPGSTSPFGVEDMAGNVWEWVRSTRSKHERVVRGGSFAYGRNSARSDNRELVEASLKDISLGMRVCADAPSPRAAVGRPGPGSSRVGPRHPRADPSAH